MPRRQTTLAGMLGDLQHLLVALAANGEDLAHLEVSRTKQPFRGRGRKGRAGATVAPEPVENTETAPGDPNA